MNENGFRKITNLWSDNDNEDDTKNGKFGIEQRKQWLDYLILQK